MPNKIKIKPVLHSDKISIDLRYLIDSNYCLGKISWKYARNRPSHERFFKEFQSFIHDFSEYEDIAEAVKQYSSRFSSSRETLLKIPYVKNMIEYFPEKLANHAKDELVHLHLKRVGKGKAVIFGFVYGQSLVILGLDAEHDFA